MSARHRPTPGSRTKPALVTAAIGIALLLGLLLQQFGAAGATTSRAAATTLPGPASAAAPPRIFAYYYLWWSSSHWKSSLGPNYPITASPKPLPATLDADRLQPAQ